MNKSKYELPDYLGFYNVALTAYANAVLGANAMMFEYGAAATRAMLRSTALATPVAATPSDGRRADSSVAATSSIDNELASIESELYSGDAQPAPAEPMVATPELAVAQVTVAELAVAEFVADLAVADHAVKKPTDDAFAPTLSPGPKGSKKPRSVVGAARSSVAMRSFGPIVAVACVALAAVSAGALADTPAGVGGTIFDATTRQPVSASLTFKRTGAATFSTSSNARGFFIALGLEPGRYTVTASAAGRTATCELDVDGGEIHRYRFALATDPRRAECEAPARYGLVDPDQSGNLYRI